MVASRHGVDPMANGMGLIASPSTEAEALTSDLWGGDAQEGLLLRLQNQNSALERLRLALDDDESGFGLGYPEAVRIGA